MDKRRDDPLIGKVFFKTYKVKRMLGEGSFGKIYSAYNINTKEEFAVKLVCIYINNKFFNNLGKKRTYKKSFRNRSLFIM